MRNYWFYDEVNTGEEFFVQANSKIQALEIAEESGWNIDELVCYGWVDDETAEQYGYDTY